MSLNNLNSIIEKILIESKIVEANGIVQLCTIEEGATNENNIENDQIKLIDNFLHIFNQCLLSKFDKLKTLANHGFQILIRDDIYWNVNSDHIFQKIICCIEKLIINQSDSHQVDFLKILLELSCIRINFLTCARLEIIINSSLSVIMSSSSLSLAKVNAAQATVFQIFQCYSKHVISLKSNQCIIVHNHLIPVIEFLSSIILEYKKFFKVTSKSLTKLNQASFVISLLLKCIQIILNQLNSDHIDQTLFEFVCKTLSPLLIKLLSLNLNKMKAKNNQMKISKFLDNHKIGRNTDCVLIYSQSFIKSKEVYNVAQELLRIFLNIEYMRPVLLSIYHRMLLYPLVHYRLEALKAVLEIFKSTHLVVKLILPLSTKNLSGKDWALFKLMMDSLKECSQTNEQEIVFTSVGCIITLLETFHRISAGLELTDEDVSKILNNPDFDFFEKSELSENDVSFSNIFESINEVVFNYEDETNLSLEQNQKYLSNIKKDILANSNSIDYDIKSYKNKLRQILKSSSDQNDVDVFISEVEPNSVKNSLCKSNFFESKSDYDDCEKIESTKYNHLKLQKTNTLKESNVEDAVSHKIKENAEEFFEALKNQLPYFLSLRTCPEVDNALQKFASKFCKEIFEKQRDSYEKDRNKSEIVIINGDGIYMAIFSALVLNLKLNKNEYYFFPDKIKPPISQQEFIEDIQKSGALIYISSNWLAELYQKVLEYNFLGEAGYTFSQFDNIPLIKMLLDIDGLGCFQELTDYRKLIQTNNSNSTFLTPKAEAGKRLIRKILQTFWNSMLTILESIFRSNPDSNFNYSLIFYVLIRNDLPKNYKEKKELIIKCLDILQMTARMCIFLGLQSLCDGIFNLLSQSVFYFTKNETRRTLSNSNKAFFHASQLLSMRAILTNALEIASYSDSCLDCAFKCCAFIIKMESEYYSSQISKNISKNFIASILKLKKYDSEMDSIYQSNDAYFASCIPGVDTNLDIFQRLDEIIKTSLEDNKINGIVQDENFEKALECLFQFSEQIFLDASSRLNLKSLLKFLEKLILNSKQQIASLNPNKVKSSSILLFSRLRDVLIKIAKSGRPLIHFMKCWSISIPHLVETAANFKLDNSISKTSIFAINDIISAALSNHNELDYFHFNESLFKPYENLLLLELCDIDTQEMVVSSICGFVEGSKKEIKSGWRSLFNAIRGVKLPTLSPNLKDYYELEIERIRQLRVILDIFEAFLNLENIKVFSNAAMDCLLCLLKLMRNESFDSNENLIVEKTEMSKVEDNLVEKGKDSVDLCLLSLKYLNQFESMLKSMYLMPNCPLFSCAQTKGLIKESKIIEIPLSLADLNFDLKATVHLADFDKPVKILHVWFLLIEGIFNSITHCPKRRQAKSIEMCMAILGGLRNVPGPQYAIYCINHIALPFLQIWLKDVYRSLPVPSQIWINLKHFLGLLSHLIVEHLKLSNVEEYLTGLDLMIKQILVILVEATCNNYHESISNLSISCFRHIIQESFKLLTEKQWEIVEKCIKTMHLRCLKSLIELNDTFKDKNLNFFDDINNIQIVTKKVETLVESQLITRGLAQNVFLLNFQNNQKSLDEIISFDENEKQFVYQLVIANKDKQIEISFTDLIHGILKNQEIVKTIGIILLRNVSHNLPNLEHMITNADNEEYFSQNLKQSTIDQFLNILLQTYYQMHLFDSRPELKVLFKKILRLKVPASLYKQSSFCLSIAFVVNFNLLLKNLNSNLLYRDKFKQLFIMICENYADFIVSNSANSQIDDIYSTPIFVLPKSSFQKNEPESENEKSELLKFKTEEEKKNDDESDTTKTYFIVREKKIDDLKKAYKKWKYQHSQIPPSFNKKLLEKNQCSKHNLTTKFLLADNSYQLQDCETFLSLWTPIMMSMVQIHLSLPGPFFQKLVECFEPGIELLVMYNHSEDLRSLLALWLRKCLTIIQSDS